MRRLECHGSGGEGGLVSDVIAVFGWCGGKMKVCFMEGFAMELAGVDISCLAPSLVL